MFTENEEVSNEDKAILDNLAKEKAKLGIVDDEPEKISSDDSTDKEQEEEVDEEESEDDEESEEDEDDDDEESSDKSKLPPKSVPIKDHKKLKQDFRTYKEETKTKLLELEETLAKYKDVDTEKEKAQLDEEVKAIAEELDVPEESLKKIIDLARKGLKPAEEIIKVEDTPAIDLEQEQKLFTEEWNNAVLAIKKQFPNATESQLARVKKEIDTIAHSKEFHQYDIDYVIFKNSDVLAKHLESPRKKGLDSTITGRQSEDGEREYKPISDVSKMSKSQILEHEKRLIEMANADPEPVRIMDNDGRERLEYI